MVTHIAIKDAAKLISWVSNINKTEALIYISEAADRGEIQAAESPDVVHCKDCENLELSGCYGECRRGYLGLVKPWDYCSRGVRRDRKEQVDA